MQTFVTLQKLEKKEMGGIQIEMPRYSMNYLTKNFEDYLNTGKSEDKIAFLENTIFKRKSLINKNSKKHNGI
jgi:hypothetical protein